MATSVGVKLDRMDRHGPAWTIWFADSCPSVSVCPSRLFRHPRPHLIRVAQRRRHQFRRRGSVRSHSCSPSLPQIILIIQPQLLQTRPRHIRQLHLHLLRRAAGLTPLRDVLDAAARGLHHLIVRPAARIDVPVAEPHRDVVDQLRHLEALQVPVAAVLGDEGFRFGHGSPCLGCLLDGFERLTLLILPLDATVCTSPQQHPGGSGR